MSRVEATARAIATRFGDRAQPAAALPGEHAVDVAPADLVAVCRELRDAPDLAFEQLIDLSGIDYLDFGRSEWTTNEATATGFSRGVERAPRAEAPVADGRFAVSYQLLSVSRYLERNLSHPRLGRLRQWYDRHLPQSLRESLPQ